ncbi:MAG: hypothetical protein R3F39_04965 [Myxococcota bacterium]
MHTQVRTLNDTAARSSARSAARVTLRVAALAGLGLVVAGCESEGCPPIGMIAVELEVQDAETLTSLCDATVEFVWPSEPSSWQTAQFYARTPGSVPPVCEWWVPGLNGGEYKLRASLPGYRSAETIVDVEATDEFCFRLKTVDFAFRLEQDGSAPR